MTNFDLFASPRILINLIANVLISGLVGSLLVYFASPDGAAFMSKPVLAGGFVPALSAFVAKMQKSPGEQMATEITKKVQSGELPDRRGAPRDGE